MRFLKQSTSVDVPIGPFLDDADGKTAETTLTLTQPDIRLKKNGAAWAQKAAAQTLSHEENGYYEVTLDATDTGTLGLLRLAVAESGALPIFEDFMVMPANVWDSLFGADALQVHAVEISNALITAASIASDAITAAKIATDAIANAKIADGAITAAKIASDAITAAKIADASIDAATFAAGAITSTVLADNAITAAKLANAAIDEATFAADTAKYQAKIWLFDDNGGSNDRYVVIWFKNGEPITAGITSPTIQVYAVADGADLIASTALTEIASTGTYRFDEGTDRIVAGAAYIAKVSATIDSATRVWLQPVGRDS